MSNLSVMQILLVEDNQHMRAIVMAILKSAGARYIREARDGAEAFDCLHQWPADLAIVDYNMDPIDGVEFTRLIRTAADSPNPYLPIIMMTGHSERSRVVQARDAGINEFIVKPLTAKAILERIQSIILRPRPYIRAPGFFGPDRRRFADPNYAGPLRRASDRL